MRMSVLMRDGAVAGADLNDFKCFQKSSKDFQRDFNRFQKVEQSYNHAEQWKNSHQLGAVACPKRISSDVPVCVSVCVCKSGIFGYTSVAMSVCLFGVLLLRRTEMRRTERRRTEIRRTEMRRTDRRERERREREERERRERGGSHAVQGCQQRTFNRLSQLFWSRLENCSRQSAFFRTI